ncbi:MAG: SDR family NAD(P)-dependent oxidoreductase [Hansschlegelia sp.]
MIEERRPSRPSVAGGGLVVDGGSGATRASPAAGLEPKPGDQRAGVASFRSKRPCGARRRRSSHSGPAAASNREDPPMAESLANTVALVTGASSGIGQATAIKLAAAGARVALVARRSERLDALAADIRAQGGEAISIAADISSAPEAQTVVARTMGELGRLDTLVNAAGVMLNGPSIESPLGDWDQMVDVNLRGLMYVTKSALPHLAEAVVTSPRKVVDVVNISSVAGRFAAAQVAIYNATKFAVTAVTEAWRQEFTRQSIRFAVVEPGATATELWSREGQWEGFTAMFGEVEPLHAEDIADAVAFAVTSPRRVAVNEIVVTTTHQPRAPPPGGFHRRAPDKASRRPEAAGTVILRATRGPISSSGRAMSAVCRS